MLMGENRSIIPEIIPAVIASNLHRLHLLPLLTIVRTINLTINILHLQIIPETQEEEIIAIEDRFTIIRGALPTIIAITTIAIIITIIIIAIIVIIITTTVHPLQEVEVEVAVVAEEVQLHPITALLLAEEGFSTTL